MDQLIKYLDQLIKYLGKNSKKMQLWVDCLIKPVFTMCAFLRAAREQDLALHYAVAKAMLPYFAAAGGVFYARYGTFYVHHLETLPKKIIENLMHDCALRITPRIFMPYTHIKSLKLLTVHTRLHGASLEQYFIV